MDRGIDYEKYPSLRVPLDEDFVESHDGRERRLLDWLKAHPDHASMKGNPTRILEAIDEYAAKHEFLINIGSDKARILAGLILEEKPRIVAEIGAYVGYAAIVMADAMKRAHQGKAGNDKLKLYSLELEDEFLVIIKEIVALAGLGGVIEVIAGPAGKSLTALSEMKTLERGGVDLVLLDHVEDLYIEELKVMEELDIFRKGSIVVADNVVRPGAPEYRVYVRSSEKWESKGVKGLIVPGEFEDELEVSRFR